MLDYVWALLAVQPGSRTAPRSRPPTASDQEIYDSIDAISGFSVYTDQGLATYTPYYYQAGTQLGSPDIKLPHLGKPEPLRLPAAAHTSSRVTSR